MRGDNIQAANRCRQLRDTIAQAQGYKDHADAVAQLKKATINYKGIKLEPCQAVAQEKQGGVWVDFCTLKDADDCYYAKLMVEGRHPQFKGTFRVMARINGIMRDIS